jgi:hypothetical protein
MIESLEIEDFRGFSKLALKRLRRVNVLVGPNGSGKTALLEAIFVAAAVSPEVVLRLRAWRGLGDRIQVTSARYEELFSDLFFRGEARRFSIVLHDEGRGPRSCAARLQAEDTTLPLDDRPLAGPTVTPMLFEWSSGGEVYRKPVRVGDEGVTFGRVPALFPSVFLASRHMPNPAENASRFSDLSKVGREDYVISAMRRMYPEIRSLSIEVNLGVSTVYAAVEGIENKIPIPLVSEGANKYLSIPPGNQLLLGRCPAGRRDRERVLSCDSRRCLAGTAS